MICPKCTANIPEGVKVCLACGYSESQIQRDLER